MIDATAVSQDRRPGNSARTGGGQRVGEAHEIGDGEGLAARRRVDADGAQRGLGRTVPPSALRSVLRRCAKAAVTTRAKSASSTMAGRPAPSGVSRATAESTFGAGENAPGGTTNRRRTAKRRLQHHGEPPVVGGGGFRGHPRDHFLLQHHVRSATFRVVPGEVEQERRADVVREVADDAQPFAQRREVERQRVGDVQRQRFRRKPLGEPRREVAVDLDRVQAAAARDQRRR